MNYYNDVNMAREHRRDLLQESQIDRAARAAAAGRVSRFVQFRQWRDNLRCRLSGVWYRLRTQTGAAPEPSACS